MCVGDEAGDGSCLGAVPPVPLSVLFALWWIFQYFRNWLRVHLCSQYVLSTGILHPCSSATWFAWELLWCELKEQKPTTKKKRPGFWGFCEISSGPLYLCHLYFSSLWTERIKSTHTATHMSIFLCAGKLELFDSNPWFDQSRAFSSL